METPVRPAEFVLLVIEAVGDARRQHPGAALVAEMNSAAVKALMDMKFALAIDSTASVRGYVIWKEMDLRIRLDASADPDPRFRLKACSASTPPAPPPARRRWRLWSRSRAAAAAR